MTPATALAGMLATMGAAHFAVPGPFDAMIPSQLPGTARQWTYGSGVAELACAALIACPGTRRTGGLAATALFVGVLPGNVKMALDARTPMTRAALVGRLPLQVPLVLWALKVRREAG